MSPSVYQRSADLAALDAELAELAAALKRHRNLPEHAERVWQRIDALLDRRIALMRDC